MSAQRPKHGIAPDNVKKCNLLIASLDEMMIIFQILSARSVLLSLIITAVKHAVKFS